MKLISQYDTLIKRRNSQKNKSLKKLDIMIVNIFVQFDEGVFHQNAGIGIQMGTNGTSLYSS